MKRLGTYHHPLSILSQIDYFYMNIVIILGFQYVVNIALKTRRIIWPLHVLNKSFHR